MMTNRYLLNVGPKLAAVDPEYAQVFEALKARAARFHWSLLTTHSTDWQDAQFQKMRLRCADGVIADDVDEEVVADYLDRAEEILGNRLAESNARLDYLKANPPRLQKMTAGLGRSIEQ